MEAHGNWLARVGAIENQCYSFRKTKICVATKAAVWGRKT